MKIEMLIPEAYGFFELSVDRTGPAMLETPPPRLIKASSLSLTASMFEILVTRKHSYVILCLF